MNNIWFLLLLSLFAVSTTAIRKLNTIEDLASNNIEFGKTFPRHGLKLLYWLVHNLQYDQNGVMQLVDPIQQRYIIPYYGSYGFHPFLNREGLLPPGRYYTLGNLNPNSHPGSRYLPNNVTWAYYNNNFDPNSNRDRIIIQLPQNSNTLGVFRVYITEHYNWQRTYELTPQLLQNIRNIGDLNTFLWQAGYYFQGLDAFNNQRFYCIWPHGYWGYGKRQETMSEHPLCDTSQSFRLEVRTSDQANARIVWSGLPETIRNKKLYVKLFASMDSSDPLDSFDLTNQESGFIDTSVHLNDRLQARLECSLCHGTNPKFETIWRGPEFDDANKRLPTEVYEDVRLQLFVKDGKACARLYINKDKTDWMQTLTNSWVGFYKSSDDEHSSYKKYQWATYFSLQENTEDEQEKQLTPWTYEYESGVDIQHGFQVRFFSQKSVDSIAARTVPWGEETLKVIQSNVQGYDVSLQLFANGGKVLARLYIKRGFTDWEAKFANSWVGFYESGSDESSSYTTYQWVTKFDRNEDMFTEEYMAYDYTSSMDAQPLGEARFFLEKDYTSIGQAVLFKGAQLPSYVHDELKM